jgi:putative DNA methylase
VTDRRLIEEELPLKEVNAQSAREKSLRHGHISTMHLWWARRPLAMSRAVVFGTLMPDPGDDAKRKQVLRLVAEASSFEASINPARIDPLRRLLHEAYPAGAPRILDCFAGGGAIPLEALRLGCDTTAIDLNPVAHLVERCTLDYPQRFGQPNDCGENPLAADFVQWAAWVRNRVEAQLAKVFPADAKGRRPAVYFWARTMTCPNPACRADIPLLSSFWLANTARRTVWLEVSGRPGEIERKVRSGHPPSTAASIRALTCGGAW